MNYLKRPKFSLILFFSGLLMACTTDVDSKEERNPKKQETTNQLVEQVDTTEQEKPIDTSSFKKKVHVMVDQLKLRAQPDLASPVLTEIDLGKTLLSNGETAGEELAITMRNSPRKGRFLQVYLPGKEPLIGWIYAGALAKEEEIFNIDPTTEKSKIELLADIKGGWRLLLFEEGYYEFSDELALTTDYGTKSNLVVKGMGDVKIVCTDPDDNVIWMGGDQLTCVNLHCYHDPPETLGQLGCTGHVIAIDITREVNITSCNLNGSGSVGIYYNMGVCESHIRYNQIHNNSNCAIFIRGDMGEPDSRLFNESDGFAELHFLENNIYNNGKDRIPE